MPKERSPNRDKAFELWIDSGGSLKLKDIAEQLKVADTQIRKWKNQDRWDNRLLGTLPKMNSNVTNKKGAPKGNSNAKGHGAPKGNKNAVGNRGGQGGPIGNDKAVTHGLFRSFLPDDEETRQIYDAAGTISPLDLLWENIQLKFTAIIRAQKLMFVRDQDDMTKEIKKTKTMSTEDMEVNENEWEIQFAWDKQATFLNAQSRAMSTLTSMIGKYEEMCRNGWGDEEQKLRIEKLKAEIEKIKSDGDDDKPTDIVVKRWSK
jgi:uncharacterized protein YjcR